MQTSLSKDDAATVHEMIAAAKRVGSFDMMGLSSGWWASAKRFFTVLLPRLPTFIRYNMSVGEYAEKFRDPFLRWVVKYLFVPDMPMSFALVLLGALGEGSSPRPACCRSPVVPVAEY